MDTNDLIRYWGCMVIANTYICSCVDSKLIRWVLGAAFWGIGTAILVSGH